MNHVLKSIFLSCISTMTLTSVFSQELIKITYDVATQKLKLSDFGTTNVNRADKRVVVWFTEDPYITKFSIVAKSANEPIIFDSQRQLLKTVYISRVDRDAPEGVEWNYSIVWFHGTKPQPNLDPKIAVKPIGGLLNLILLSGFAIIMAITSIVFFAKWRKAEANLKIK